MENIIEERVKVLCMLVDVCDIEAACTEGTYREQVEAEAEYLRRRIFSLTQGQESKEE